MNFRQMLTLPNDLRFGFLYTFYSFSDLFIMNQFGFFERLLLFLGLFIQHFSLFHFDNFLLVLQTSSDVFSILVFLSFYELLLLPSRLLYLIPQFIMILLFELFPHHPFLFLSPHPLDLLPGDDCVP